VDGVPSVLQVLQAVLPNFDCGRIRIAQEFPDYNTTGTRELFKQAAGAVPLQFEPHLEFKQRVPRAVGLIRTGDITSMPT
jgi:D-ribose pyranase